MTDQEKPVETEEIEINGTPVVVEQTADTLTVTLPEGLDDTAKEELRKSIEGGNVSKLVAAWNRKNQLKNQELAEIEKLKAEFSQPKPTPDTLPKQPDTTEKPLWKQLGLESEADLDDFAADHPARYMKALSDYNAAETERKMEIKLAQERVLREQEYAQNTLISNIRARGLDPAEVQAFATYYGMPLSERALQLYLQQHADKSNPVLAAQVAAQKAQINYVEQSHYRHKGNLTQQEMDSLSDEDLAAYRKYMVEKASRE
jgi:hypothetical protein